MDKKCKNPDNNTRDHYIDVWMDLFSYASNLKGNWHTSKEIFYKNLLPTAESNPNLFASWVNGMIKTSGIKIKDQSTFYKALDFLGQKQSNSLDIIQTLTKLIYAGLDEPDYAQKAINNAIQKI